MGYTNQIWLIDPHKLNAMNAQFAEAGISWTEKM